MYLSVYLKVTDEGYLQKAHFSFIKATVLTLFPAMTSGTPQDTGSFVCRGEGSILGKHWMV